MGYTIIEPDGELWHRYDEMAARSFGHRVSDITALREHASARVALRDGRVVAGGLGLLVPQYFGGKPVPAACLAAGCVAPEERGNRLADELMIERLRPLREGGAVVATIWTSSNAYVRHLDWQAPTPVNSWSVTTDDLRHSFNTGEEYEIEPCLTAAATTRHSELAAEWNGPVRRPAWWWSWTQAKHGLTTYQLSRPGQSPDGVIRIGMARREPRGMKLVVHDFWAADAGAVSAIFRFLGGFHSRADTVQFRRGALPPHAHQTLLHGLRRYRPTVEAWHPWMLQVLDIPAALQLRGWPTDLSLTATIGISGDVAARYRLRITGGAADVEIATTTAHCTPEITFTPGQFAVWYAGGYTNPNSAHHDGLRSTSPETLATLLRATHHQTPWLPDLF